MFKYFNDKNSLVVDVFVGTGLDWKFIFVFVCWLSVGWRLQNPDQNNVQ